MTADSLPRIDLHRHLDGSVRVQTIIDLANQHNLALPAWTVEELLPVVQVTSPQPGILAFFEKFKWQTLGMVDENAIRRIAYENVEDAALEGLDYIELRFSPFFMAQAHRLDAGMVTRAVVEGVQDGIRDFCIPVGLIGILSRTYGADAAWKELDAILGCRDGINGLDLAGDEIHYPGVTIQPTLQESPGCRAAYNRACWGGRGSGIGLAGDPGSGGRTDWARGACTRGPRAHGLPG